MLRYIAKRLLISIPVLIGLTAMIFAVMHSIPGDPVQIWLGLSLRDPRAIQVIRARLGLDQPVYVQYFLYLTRLLQGNFGTDIRTGQPVLQEVLPAFMLTLELAATAWLIAILLGIPFGIISARRQNSIIDRSIMITSVGLSSLPNFWLGVILILIFSVTLHLTPVAGYASSPQYIILPALALGLGQLGVTARFTRSSLLEVLRQDYIRSAKARGLSEFKITVSHALKNALVPIITLSGLQLGYLLGGAFFVEVIFAWPGIGRLAYRAITERNYPLLQASVFFVAVAFVVINIVVDVLYARIDPRIQVENKEEEGV
ncbi:MAG TPA: ABC transporter permease [Nitrososphaerales archaeon]|nr:ABC transporter permease [Nitrososphaerales archaeon]